MKLNYKIKTNLTFDDLNEETKTKIYIEIGKWLEESGYTKAQAFELGLSIAENLQLITKEDATLNFYEYDNEDARWEYLMDTYGNEDSENFDPYYLLNLTN